MDVIDRVRSYVRGRRAGRDETETPPVPHAPDSARPAAPSTGAWRRADPMVLTMDSNRLDRGTAAAFPGQLATRRPPLLLRALDHGVDPKMGGFVADIASLRPVSATALNRSESLPALPARTRIGGRVDRVVEQPVPAETATMVEPPSPGAVEQGDPILESDGREGSAIVRPADSPDGDLARPTVEPRGSSPSRSAEHPAPGRELPAPVPVRSEGAPSVQREVSVPLASHPSRRLASSVVEQSGPTEIPRGAEVVAVRWDGLEGSDRHVSSPEVPGADDVSWSDPPTHSPDAGSLDTDQPGSDRAERADTGGSPAARLGSVVSRSVSSEPASAADHRWDPLPAPGRPPAQAGGLRPRPEWAPSADHAPPTAPTGARGASRETVVPVATPVAPPLHDSGDAAPTTDSRESEVSPAVAAAFDVGLQRSPDPSPMGLDDPFTSVPGRDPASPGVAVTTTDALGPAQDGPWSVTGSAGAAPRGLQSPTVHPPAEIAPRATAEPVVRRAVEEPRRRPVRPVIGRPLVARSPSPAPSPARTPTSGLDRFLDLARVPDDHREPQGLDPTRPPEPVESGTPSTVRFPAAGPAPRSDTGAGISTPVVHRSPHAGAVDGQAVTDAWAPDVRAEATPVIQREVDTAVGNTPSPIAAPSTEELVDKVYQQVQRRLRTDMRLEQERKGRMSSEW